MSAEPRSRRRTPRPSNVEIVEITPEEWEREFDAEARKRLGISGDEFRRRWQLGEYLDQDTDNIWSVAFYLGDMAPRK